MGSQNPRWPATVDEAAEMIIEGMSEEDRAVVRSTKRGELIRFHHGWGTGIRNDLGLWQGIWRSSSPAVCFTRMAARCSSSSACGRSCRPREGSVRVRRSPVVSGSWLCSWQTVSVAISMVGRLNASRSARHGVAR